MFLFGRRKAQVSEPAPLVGIARIFAELPPASKQVILDVAAMQAQYPRTQVWMPKTPEETAAYFALVAKRVLVVDTVDFGRVEVGYVLSPYGEELAKYLNEEAIAGSTNNNA